MSVGPRAHLALLWPWLLMALLQVHLGYSGLTLVSAMEAERSLAQKAIIRVVPLKLQPLTLEGVFASVAEVTPAEGKLLQFHPLSLCNTSEDEHTVPGFISIVKLERPERDLRPCLSLANKAKLAGERGAQAVLFDITDDQSAADQLRNPWGLSHPVVLIWGHDAEMLMGVVNNNREAHVKIEVKEMPAWQPDYDVWILLTVVSTVVVIILIFIVRTRCHPGRSQTNVQEETLQAINQLATRRYRARCWQASAGDSASTCSSAPVCVICLEEFSEGQELRIITCFHEFHRQCVDPWLQQHQTCPLCMFNIVDRSPSAVPVHSHEDPHHRLSGRRPRFFRQHPGRALHHFPRNLPPMPPRSCSSGLPHGHPFFHSPELSQLDLGTVHYLPYRAPGFEPWCRQQQPSRPWNLCEPSSCEQALPSRRSCLLQHQPPCRGFKAPVAAKLTHAAAPPNRGTRHGRHHHHHHHHHHGGSSGESYHAEPSGYVPDGPGSDSSSGPCHGSSSDSVLNCTDISLQAIHGSCSTFHSSLSSDYDPFAFCGSEREAPDSKPELSPSWRDARPQLADPGGGGRPPVAASHVHYHHHLHRHHHYGQNPLDYQSRRSSQELGPRRTKYPRAKLGTHGAQVHKRTEKTQSPEGVSAPHAVPLLPQGQSEVSSADTCNLGAAAADQTGVVRPRIPPKRYLQIHPSRRRWKCAPQGPEGPAAKVSGGPSGVGVPGRSGSTPGSCCSLEAQPLLTSDSSAQHPAALPHSVTVPQEPGGSLRPLECQPSSPGDSCEANATGNATEIYLNCQLPSQLQGSRANVAEVYEHSV